MKQLTLIFMLLLCLTGCGSNDSENEEVSPIIYGISVYNANGTKVYDNDNQLLNINGLVKFDANLDREAIVTFSYSIDSGISFTELTELDLTGMEGELIIKVYVENIYGSDNAVFIFEIIKFYQNEQNDFELFEIEYVYDGERHYSDDDYEMGGFTITYVDEIEHHYIPVVSDGYDYDRFVSGMQGTDPYDDYINSARRIKDAAF